jgi:hypothetical protein
MPTATGRATGTDRGLDFVLRFPSLIFRPDDIDRIDTIPCFLKKASRGDREMDRARWPVFFRTG